MLEHTENSITLFYQSVDGEQGFPGNLDVTVKYTLTDSNELAIDYFAITDKDTIVSLSNHSYFNVSGTENTTDGILLYINADNITPADEKLIVHGEFQKLTARYLTIERKRLLLEIYLVIKLWVRAVVMMRTLRLTARVIERLRIRLVL